MLSALTESHSDVRRHAVVLILATLDGLQAGPVGGGIRARKADERVGCKRKANLTQGLVGRSHLAVPTSVTWDVLHLATATLSVPVLSTCNRGFFSPKNWPSEGFKPKGCISSSYQLKLVQPQPGTSCHPRLHQERVPAAAANWKPNSRSKFLRLGLVQLSHHRHSVPAWGRGVGTG